MSDVQEPGKKLKDIKDRTREYAMRIIKLYSALPAGKVARVIGDQILRSGTSVGPTTGRGFVRDRARSTPPS